MLMCGLQALGSVLTVAPFTEPHLSLAEILPVEKIYQNGFCILAYPEGGVALVWSGSEPFGSDLGNLTKTAF